mgnify:CR=1 FL=1
MKKSFLLLPWLLILLFTGCNQQQSENQKSSGIENQPEGTWIKFGPAGIHTLEFKEKGIVETDLGNDGTIDVVSEFKVLGDMVLFSDVRGETCPGEGRYLMDLRDEYVSFDLVADSCAGRIKSTMGFWTRPNFQKLIKDLDQEIQENTAPDLLLTRARVYMASGQSKKAKSDLDQYISQDSTNARAFLNRASVRFPQDMQGALADCNKSVSLDPVNKNAYFLRGLALYSLGKKEKACADFNTAIELGFTILRQAEWSKCAEFWEKE